MPEFFNQGVYKTKKFGTGAKKWGGRALAAGRFLGPGMFVHDIASGVVQADTPGGKMDALVGGTAGLAAFEFGASLAMRGGGRLLSTGLKKIAASSIFKSIAREKDVAKVAGWGAKVVTGGVSTGTIVGTGIAAAATGTAYGWYKYSDVQIQAERERRKFTWSAHTAPFRTQKAATMRQQSLALMNRGAMSSRSLLGQEAVYVHK